MNEQLIYTPCRFWIGNEKESLQVPEVDIIPLKKERYDMVIYQHN